MRRDEGIPPYGVCPLNQWGQRFVIQTAKRCASGGSPQAG